MDITLSIDVGFGSPSVRATTSLNPLQGETTLYTSTTEEGTCKVPLAILVLLKTCSPVLGISVT